MSYKGEKFKNLRKQCALCSNNFMVWLGTLNFESEKESDIKKQMYNYCPVCKTTKNAEKITKN